MDKLLKVKSLKSWYGASQALFDVNLEVNQGEIVALLGRNGMGKSTTIKSICGLINKYEGEINFNERLKIFWGEEIVGQLLKGSTVFSPIAEALDNEYISSEKRLLISAKLQKWIDELIKILLWPTKN